MSINARTDLIPLPYTQGDIPSAATGAASDEKATIRFLVDELDKLKRTVADLIEASPQVADDAPPSPRKGTIRYAVAPWDPLGTAFSGYVVYTGSAWAAL